MLSIFSVSFKFISIQDGEFNSATKTAEYMLLLVFNNVQNSVPAGLRNVPVFYKLNILLGYKSNTIYM